MSSAQSMPAKPGRTDLSARRLQLSVQQVGVAERSAFARREHEV
jgi:hypothetical protein